MKTLSTLLCFSLIFSSISTQLIHVAAREKCNPVDKKVLFKIKKALHDPYHLASWKHHTDRCDWDCVQCDPKTNRIFSLVINNGDINGHIPYLETLWLRKLTNLTGTIQTAIAKLTRLKDLTLSRTHLFGPIPSFLNRLKNLQTLDLSYNRLTGQIPPSLTQLPKLGELYLHHNKFTGSIPITLRLRGPHPYLFLSKNQLSGKIPAGLAKTNFSDINLSCNKLKGDASFLFRKNKAMYIMDLSRNKLSFEFSHVKEFPPKWITLDLSHNNIAGSLLAGLTKLPHLQLFNVSYNRLCGKIPVIGELRIFDEYCYVHNKCLCGAPLHACKKLR